MNRYLLILIACLWIHTAGADVIVISSKSVILGHIHGETNNCLLIEVRQGKFAVDINTIEYVSRSPTHQDTYLDAARRLIQENQPAYAAICLDRSLQEESETRKEAMILKENLYQSKLDTLSKSKNAQSSSSLIMPQADPLRRKAKAAELRKQGEILIRMGEAAKKATVLDKSWAANSRQLAEKRISEGQKLLAHAKQIEDQLRPKPKPKPWYQRLFEWAIGKSQPDKETSPEDVYSKDLVRVLLLIALGVLAVLGLIYFLFFRH